MHIRASWKKHIERQDSPRGNGTKKSAMESLPLTAGNVSVKKKKQQHASSF